MIKALVTGASDDGIGGGIARELARLAAADGGGAIALSTTGRRGVPHILLRDIEELGVGVRHFLADLTEPAACRELAESASDFCDGMSVFVSNAGAMRPGLLESLSVADWDFLFDANLRPTLLIAQALLPALKASQGSVVAVSSITGGTPAPGAGAYPPSKAALEMLVRQMALEWAAHGVRVNAVAPGMVETHLTRSAYAAEDVHAARKRVVPMGRIGTPEDMGKATAFLAGPGATYITGQTLTVDGGFIDSVYTHVPTLTEVPR